MLLLDFVVDLLPVRHIFVPLCFSMNQRNFLIISVTHVLHWSWWPTPSPCWHLPWWAFYLMSFWINKNLTSTRTQNEAPTALEFAPLTLSPGELKRGEDLFVKPENSYFVSRKVKDAITYSKFFMFLNKIDSFPLNLFNIDSRILVLWTKDDFSTFDNEIEKWGHGFDLKNHSNTYSDHQKGAIESAMCNFLELNPAGFKVIINPKLSATSGAQLCQNNPKTGSKRPQSTACAAPISVPIFRDSPRSKWVAVTKTSKTLPCVSRMRRPGECSTRSTT